jgi:hypothetical protein
MFKNKPGLVDVDKTSSILFVDLFSHFLSCDLRHTLLPLLISLAMDVWLVTRQPSV